VNSSYFYEISIFSADGKHLSFKDWEIVPVSLIANEKNMAFDTQECGDGMVIIERISSWAWFLSTHYLYNKKRLSASFFEINMMF